MRNFKRLVASLLATMMVMGVSAFAADATTEVTGTQGFGSYTGGEVILTGCPVDVDGQVTVVIIPAEKANETLTDADILYINQGTKADTFWTDGMGTITDLTTGFDAESEEVQTKEYIVRVGGTNVTTISEITLTVTYTPATSEEPEGVIVQLGDANLDGNCNGLDVNPIVQHILNVTTLSGKAYFASDANSDKNVNGLDVNPIVQHILNVTPLGEAIYIAE